MLVEFRVENHRSLRDEQVLSLEARASAAASDSRPRRVAGYGSHLLPTAAIYGANASGKSNVLSALAFARDAVVESHRQWPSDGGVPRASFAWGLSASEPSLFEVTLVLDGVRFEYGFVANDERFVEEWLFAWPKGRKQTWFLRDATDEADTYSFGRHLRGDNETVRRVTRPNALFLSTASQLSHEQLSPLHLWFSSLCVLGVAARGRDVGRIGRLTLEGTIDAAVGMPFRLYLALQKDADPLGEQFKAFIRAFDVGIVDIRTVPTHEDPGGPTYGRKSGSLMRLRHRSSADDAWLPLGDESRGTVSLIGIAPYIMDALDAGAVLAIDELEASLHPLIALQVVRLFNDPATNPHNAQLIFTTHDTHLLGRKSDPTPLRRDQIWLTEKDAEGATTLYPLTDYKPRKAENLETGYLQGRYGAIPFLDAIGAE